MLAAVTSPPSPTSRLPSLEWLTHSVCVEFSLRLKAIIQRSNYPCARATFIRLITEKTFAILFTEPEDYVLRSPIDDHCYSTILSAHSQSFTVLGTTWLRKYYTVLDIDHKTIGFALRL